MDELSTQLNEALAHGESVVLLTVIEVGDLAPPAIAVGNKLLLLADGSRIGSLGDQSLDAAASIEAQYQAGRSRTGTLTLWSENFQAPANSLFARSVHEGSAVT